MAFRIDGHDQSKVFYGWVFELYTQAKIYYSGFLSDCAQCPVHCLIRQSASDPLKLLGSSYRPSEFAKATLAGPNPFEGTVYQLVRQPTSNPLELLGSSYSPRTLPDRLGRTNLPEDTGCAHAFLRHDVLFSLGNIC